MKTQKSPLSIRIIYWISTGSIALLAMVFVAALIFNVLLYTDFFGNNMQLHVQFPVKIDFLETGTLSLNGQDVDVEFVEASSKIHFFNTPSFITKKAGIAILIVTSFAIYLLWVFRKFIMNVKNGLTFNIENISLLKKLSYGLLGFWLFSIIYMQFLYYYIAKNIEMANIRISHDFTDQSNVLLFALFIWVLAHIFITGLKLQEEQDLTV
ncbi:MAG: DUF2975 domain-containing protein [Bacteroidales bacterium]|nr:DUF2975 domain-containing protein [Bacteroidales bacterium]